MIDEDSFDDDPELVQAAEAEIAEDASSETLLELGDNVEIKEVDSDEESQHLSGRSQEFAGEEEEPMETDDDLLARAREIYNKIVRSCSFSAKDLDFIVKLYTMSSSGTHFIDWLSDDAITGFYNLVFEKKVPASALTALFKFFSIVAIETHGLDQPRPLYELNGALDVFLDAADTDHRFLGCQLTAILLNQASKVQNLAGSQNVPLPTEIIQDWCIRLSQRQVDSSPVVRSLALEAFSRIPIDDFTDIDGKMTSPSLIIAKSLYDIAPEVRKAAIKQLPMSSAEILDDAIEYLVNEPDFQLRRLMIEHLCTQVHIRSFTMQQRMRLIGNIYNDPNPNVKHMVATLLVPRWLRWLTQEDSDERMDVSDPGFVPTAQPAYPMSLVEFLDYLEQEEDAVIVIKMAFTHFMQAVVGSPKDAKQLLLYMREFPKELRETAGILHKLNLAGIVRKDDIDLPQRLFVHRCLIELITELYAGSANLCDRDHCINKLLPNFKELATLFKDYSERIFMGGEEPSSIQVFSLRQISLLIRCVDLECSLGRQIYSDALRKVALDESFYPPDEMVTFAVDQLWSTVIRGTVDNELLEWTSEAGNILLDAVDFHPSEEKDVRVREPNKFMAMIRVATVIHGILSQGQVVDLPTALLNICIRIVPSLAVAATVEGRILCCRLLAVVGLRSTGTFVNHHTAKLPTFIELDRPQVKAVALSCLADLTIKHNVQYIADRCFPEIQNPDQRRKTLHEVFEQFVIRADDQILAGVVETALRLSVFLPWGNLIGCVMFRLFCSGQEHLQEVELLEHFTKDWVEQQGVRAKIPLLNGFCHCVGMAEEEPKFRYGQLMSLVSKNISRKAKAGVQDTLPDEMTIETLLVLNMLRLIADDPFAKSSQSLACVCLSGINLEHIASKHTQKVVDEVERLFGMLSGDFRLRKMHSSVGVLRRSLKKKFNLEAAKEPVKKTRKRAPPVEHSKSQEEDPDFVLSTPIRVSQKRPRTRLSSSAEAIKSDNVISSPSMTSNSSEEVVIEDIFDDDNDFIPPPSPISSQARSRKSRSRSSQPVVF